MRSPVADRRSPGAGAGAVSIEPGSPGTPVLEVALVNNMPDSAFADAEHQFTRLVLAGAAAAGRQVDLRLFSLADERRCEVVRRRLADRYEGLHLLSRRPPDAVVITGSEPRCADLRDEVIWEDLSNLVRWAGTTGTPLLCSCLAAHAALLTLAGVARHRLPAKLSGVFAQAVRPGHPLTAGVGPVGCPHSRFNDVAPAAVEAAGFNVLIGGPASGWSVAAGGAGGLTVLMQGHPEYAPTTLLREYRRDVGRYLAGERPDHPEIPSGYLDAEGNRLLERFRRAVVRRGAPSGLLDRFPFEACAERVATDWRRPMERLYANWVTTVAAAKLQHSWRRAG